MVLVPEPESVNLSKLKVPNLIQPEFITSPLTVISSPAKVIDIWPVSLVTVRVELELLAAGELILLVPFKIQLIFAKVGDYRLNNIINFLHTKPGLISHHRNASASKFFQNFF